MSTDPCGSLKKILIVFGTRPEAVKLAPLINIIKEKKELFILKICSTGQHKQMLAQVLKIFSITPDHELDIMKDGQDLFDVTNNVLSGLKKVISMEQPDIVLVQGDTTTAFAASLAAYYSRVRVAHIEAGLRTGDKYNPFPEEINRKLISATADIHFAPTESAMENLLKENIDASRVFVTGNTVVDALMAMVKRWDSGELDGVQSSISLLDSIPASRDRKLLLVTCHRRESFGRDIENICQAIRDIADNVPDTVIIYPVHMNPNIMGPVHRILDGTANVHLIQPLDYEAFLYLLNRAYLVLTDSGGIQEEAPSLGKPVLIMRSRTERPEGITHGMARLVGTSRTEIASVTSHILSDRSAYDKMVPSINPYGDGSASRVITKILEGII